MNPFKPGDRVTVDPASSSDHLIPKSWLDPEWGLQAIREPATVLEVTGDHCRIAFDIFVTSHDGTQFLPWLHYRALRAAS